MKESGLVARYVVRVARQAVLIGVFAATALLGSLSGVLFVYAEDLPQVSALDDYAPSTITRILGADGGVIGDFATQRRVVIGYEEISPLLRQAIMSAEDADFDSHVGFSLSRIIITAARDLMEMRLAAGASTLTQQLARNLFLTSEKTIERKVKEALLAIQIEKRYTKPEIFTIYCNQIYLGHGAYGVEAASRLYFGKSAKDLSLEEAALIAGIIQLPSRQSPYVDLAYAERRRNYALDRMAAEGYVTFADAAVAKASPIVTVGRGPSDSAIAPYFVEEVRQHLEAKYGAKPLYEGGLTVETTLDRGLQEAANAALTEGLRALDKRLGFRDPATNVIEGDITLETYRHPAWAAALEEGRVHPAVVTGASADQITTRVGSREVIIPAEGFAWAGRAPSRVELGDLVEVRVTALPDEGPAVGSLEQEPEIEGAILIIENRTGQILAMVGGYDFERSKFNRAVQAMRQVGSTFKAFLYTTAIDRGYTPATLLLDEPTTFEIGPGLPPYEPHNYDVQFLGPMTLRRALELSRNVPAVQLMSLLGPQQVIQHVQRFGLTSPMEPYLSLALGAAEASLLEITSAFSVFPNRGVRMTPYLIERVIDREQNVLEQHRQQSQDVIRADTAFLMTNLLRGVVQRGTAARANALEWPLGGKTGTTDDWSDAWMLGFDPDVTVGVWVGYDVKRSLGNGESGSRVALPIWIDVMRSYIGDRTERPEFPRPSNIVTVAVNRQTGEVAMPGSPDTIQEVFIAGTQPGAGFPARSTPGSN